VGNREIEMKRDGRGVGKSKDNAFAEIENKTGEGSC
jgi:hypothetical protein